MSGNAKTGEALCVERELPVWHALSVACGAYEDFRKMLECPETDDVLQSSLLEHEGRLRPRALVPFWRLAVICAGRTRRQLPAPRSLAPLPSGRCRCRQWAAAAERPLPVPPFLKP